MFIPNINGTLERQSGTNVYGKATFYPPVPVACGIVRLELMNDPTTVRADSSASRGSAHEESVLSRVLVTKETMVSNGDRLNIANHTLTVQSVWPRYAVTGQLDHYQLDLTINAQ